MKFTGFKKVGILAIAGALSLSALAGCGSGAASSSASSDASAASSNSDKVIKVGASPTPHAEILSVVEEQLAEKGYDLEIVEYNDYVLPNTSLESGDIDANYFQHITYLNDFNEQNGTHLVSVADVHFEPLGIYAGKTSSLDDLADGATVAVSNDTTNEARALLLLEDQGLIKLKEGAGITATKLDIVENPKNLVIQEIEAAQVPRVLPDVDVAAINGNYALNAGLDVADALATESSDGTVAQAYANVVAVKEGTENDEKILALKDAILSDDVKNFINEKYNGAVVALF